MAQRTIARSVVFDLWYTLICPEDFRGCLLYTSQADVDAMATWLTARGTALLFDTPRHRPEFAGGDGQTYYQIMFETPDRILVEVVYTGACLLYTSRCV